MKLIVIIPAYNEEASSYLFLQRDGQPKVFHEPFLSSFFFQKEKSSPKRNDFGFACLMKKPS